MIIRLVNKNRLNFVKYIQMSNKIIKTYYKTTIIVIKLIKIYLILLNLSFCIITLTKKIRVKVIEERLICNFHNVHTAKPIKNKHQSDKDYY